MRAPDELASGTKLGPYRIESLIGAGGMGEVYRAKDTRLDRTVAIKILPSHLRGSADLRARFDREARTISQLTHPHICTLHDVGHENGTDFLVMEYLEGETLAARLARGAMPLGEALRIGVQAAGALDHAHRQGIIHRDLKPANVILTRTGVKLLDFGLAKLRPTPALIDGLAPTAIESGITAAGTLLGTLHYMAPELLEGQEADARSDIWALGCVLYELAAGRKAFDGATHASLIAAILERPPAPLQQSGRASPAALEHLIGVCLAKQRDARWQSAADVARGLEGIGSEAHRRETPTLGWRGDRAHVFAAAAALLVAAAAFLWWRETSRPVAPASVPPTVRASVPLAQSGLNVDPGGLAISPDGQTLVFAAKGRDGQRLYQRRLSETDVRPLPGTDGAIAPFFSPDGGWVAYLVQGQGLFKTLLSGGPPQLICEAGAGESGTWGADGRIIFATVAGKEGTGLWTVAAEGGAAKSLLRSRSGDAVAYLKPELLPGDKTVLYTIREAGHAAVAALDLATGKVTTVIDGSQARYASSGHLLYLFSNHLYAIEFDAARLQTRGAGRVVLENMGDETNGNGLFAISGTGTLAYVSRVAAELVWVDRAGMRTPMDLDPRPYSFPALSRDGRLLAVTVAEGAGRNIWIGGTAGGPLTKLTSGNDNVFSLFTPDGKRVVYTAGESGRYNLFWIPADGSGPASSLTNTPHSQKATSFSNDGQIMLLNDIDKQTGLDILQMEVGRPESIRPFRQTPAIELGGSFSPDGHWVAYLANDTGRPEAYVEAFPGPGGSRSRVSTGGVQIPVWNPRGGELLYQGPSAIMSVPFLEGHAAGPPSKVLDHPQSAGFVSDWTISPDGRRFLMIERSTSTSPSEIYIALNWLTELKSRMPIAK